MQIRAHIAYFITISVILIMAACSVASHSTQDRQEIIPVPQPSTPQDTTGKNSLPETDTPVQASLPAPQQTADRKDKENQTSATDSVPNIAEKTNTPARQDTTATAMTQSTDSTDVRLSATEPDSVQAKPLFNDIISYKADDSIKFSIQKK
ncbi:MAG: hypothetical protein K2M86_03225 [Odoribacter sp.]|nr:hypothetical protein [Odoribacter sp.]